MTRPINQILNELLQKTQSIGNLGNIEGIGEVPVNLRQASVVSFSREAFEALSEDEQRLLASRGYGFGEIRTKAQPEPRVHDDAFYVVSKRDGTGDVMFLPAYNFLSETELKNVAAYNASVQLTQVKSGGGAAPAAQPPLDNRINAHQYKDDIGGKQYTILSDEHVNGMPDVLEMFRRGWVRMNVDGVDQWVRELGGGGGVLQEE